MQCVECRLGDGAVPVTRHVVRSEVGTIVADGMGLCEGDAFGWLLLGVSLLVLGVECGLRRLVGWARVAARLGWNASGSAMRIVVVDSVTLGPVLAQHRHGYGEGLLPGKELYDFGARTLAVFQLV